ncbi:hypothetical protein BV20DRAFT_169255 [Pilatotrama ljubarskyi]|nr:hypothetical protein BV20DRAFT_169255 [Pilatotrama ljubarskyi]
MSRWEPPHPALRRALEYWAHAGLVDTVLSDIRELLGDPDVRCDLISTIGPEALVSQAMSVYNGIASAAECTPNRAAENSSQVATDSSDHDKHKRNKEIYDLVISALTCTQSWRTRHAAEHFPWNSVFTRILRISYADRVVLRYALATSRPTKTLFLPSSLLMPLHLQT